MDKIGHGGFIVAYKRGFFNEGGGTAVPALPIIFMPFWIANPLPRDYGGSTLQ
jgi:hypothetical protein